MKCRAKMIDGSPVTFEMIDHGMYANVYITEFVGEGFHVRSVWPRFAPPRVDRLEWDRQSLELAGVDTATVEHLHCWDGKGGETWVKVWPGKRDTSYLEAMSEPLKDFMGVGGKPTSKPQNITVSALADEVVRLAEKKLWERLDKWLIERGA